MKDRIATAWGSIRRTDGSVTRGLSSILGLRLIEKISGLIVTMLLFRSLDKEQLAQYGFLQTVVAMCAVFGIQEFQNTIAQSVARGHAGTFRAAVPLSLRWSLVGTLILIGVGAWYLGNGQTSLAIGFFIVAPLFPCLHALNQWKGLYLGEGNFSAFSKAEAVNALIKTVLLLCALLLFPGSLLPPILVFFMVPTFQNLWQSRRAWRRVPADAPAEAGAIAYGLRSNVYSAIGIVVANLDRVLIFTLLTPAMLATYMAAEKFAELLQGMVQDLGAVLATKFSKIERYSLRLDDALKLVALAIAVFVLLFAWIAVPPLTVLIFGKAYADSIVYAQLLVATVAVGNIATLRFRFIRSKLDAASYRNVLLSGSFAKLAASVVLIPLFGLAGAVGSVFVHRLVMAAITSYTIQSRYLPAQLKPAESTEQSP